MHHDDVFKSAFNGIYALSTYEQQQRFFTFIVLTNALVRPLHLFIFLGMWSETSSSVIT